MTDVLSDELAAREGAQAKAWLSFPSDVRKWVHEELMSAATNAEAAQADDEEDERYFADVCQATQAAIVALGLEPIDTALTWRQDELADLQKRLKAAESENERLRSTKALEELVRQVVSAADYDIGKELRPETAEDPDEVGPELERLVAVARAALDDQSRDRTERNQ